MRRCPVCGASLEDRRPQCQACSPRCRRKLNRWRRLVAGLGDGPYSCIDDYDERLRKRANRRTARETASY